MNERREEARGYPAVCPEKRSRTLARMVEVSRSIPNLAFCGGRSDGCLDEMLSLKLKSPDAIMQGDRLKATLREIWNGDLTPSDTMLSRFVDTISGFEYVFALLHGCGEIVTGRVSVDLAPDVE